MNKREARQIALHVIFEMEFKTKEEFNEILDQRLNPEIYSTLIEDIDFYEKRIPEKFQSYIIDCAEGTLKNIENIDETISKLSTDWSINRISKMSLAILRLAIFEIKYMDDIPVGASINEAVDLAKMYDSEEAGSFINGILGTLAKEIDG